MKTEMDRVNPGIKSQRGKVRENRLDELITNSGLTGLIESAA